jgi:hypothetical protein
MTPVSMEGSRDMNRRRFLMGSGAAACTTV